MSIEKYSTLVDDLKESIDPRTNSWDHGGLWGICCVNFINLCMKYSAKFPIAFLCFYLSIFVSTSIWVCKDSLTWKSIPSTHPQRTRYKPKLGKRGKYYRRSRKTNEHRDKPHVDTKWYEVTKGGRVKPIHLTNRTGWESLHPPVPTLDPGYAQWFDGMCCTYDWYLDAVIHPNKLLGPGISDKEVPITSYGQAANIEDDLYLPKSCYIGIGGHRILFDSGCTTTVTPYLDDFVGGIKYVKGREMQGLSATTKVVGIGMVEWDFQDDYGIKHTIRIKANYVPAAKFRLFSPQAYFLEHQAGSFHLNHRGTVFTFAEGGKLSFDYAKRSLLPFTRGTKTVRSSKAFVGEMIKAAVNLTQGQIELRNTHDKLGHYDIRKTQSLFKGSQQRAPILNPICPQAATCKVPLCRACMMGKARLQSMGNKSSTPNVDHSDVIKNNDLAPGIRVSSDQYVCRIKGRLPYSRGQEDPKEMFSGGTIFVDHGSGFIRNYNQVGLGATDTIHSKELFELEADGMGVAVRSYHADNGIYKSKEFQKDLDKRHQILTLSGVGAHGQNGVAERGIQTVVNSARTMMLHQALMWPEHFDMRLWSFALDYATHLWNHLPNRDGGLSPMEIFSGSKSDYSSVKTAKTWGCPAYVLDPRLQDGKKIPKWDPRARRGQFVGISPRHASNIGMIRNLSTGYISPQFHVVYDNEFQTVLGGYGKNEAVCPHIWENLCIHSRENGLTEVPTADKPIPRLHEDWLTPDQQEDRTRKDINSQVQYRVRTELDRQAGIVPIVDSTDMIQPPDDKDTQNTPLIIDLVESEDDEPRYPKRANRGKGGIDTSIYDLNDSTWTDNDSSMLCEGNPAIKDDDLQSIFKSDLTYLATVDTYSSNIRSTPPMRYLEGQSWTSEEGVCDNWHPYSFAARLSGKDEDNPTYNDILRGSSTERALWEDAMVKELKSLGNLGSFKMIKRPSEGNILDSTWAFRKKRYPDGSLKKYKARFCVRGDQQIDGVDVFETYAPVVSWITVRLLMILSITMGLYTQQVDYTNAFCQAPLDQVVYVELPRGFERKHMVLELQQSVYGLKQSPLNFYRHLRQGLESRGFIKSAHDDCLFNNGEVIVLFWVDDCIFYSKEMGKIQQIIDSLKNEFLLEKEEDMAGFLGLDISHSKDGKTITLTQMGLINRILKACGMEDSNPKSTPAEITPIGKDLDGDPCKEKWDYRSIVGMMLYLAGTSRPDISYSVHQCARFSHSPKHSHEIAVKHIVRYLKGTRDKGLIMKPNMINNLQFNLYADADFAGLFASEDKLDPICAKSRTGILLTLGNVPIFWSSKLQTEISMSTLEAEYIALSSGMRELVAARGLMFELSKQMKFNQIKLSNVSKAWEDNTGAQNLANSKGPLMSSRTKHIGIKYHWFRSKIIDGEIEIERIATDLQKADIFTKCSSKSDFEAKRKLVMGW